MKRLFIWLLWALVMTGVCVAGDQLLLHSSMNSPAFRAAQIFYQDFRGRIIQFVKKEDHRPKTVKEYWPAAVLSEVREKIEPLSQPKAEPGGYVYTDRQGGLHLATHLEEVPSEYRAAAKPLQK